MNRQTMVDLAQRVARAPSNDARMHELMHYAPNSTLARFGLAHRSSGLGALLGVTGAFAIGAMVGAGVAALLTPTSGKELQTKLRGQGTRLSGAAKKTADRAGSKPDTYDHDGAPGARADGTPPGERQSANA